jgi:hypothetical protein
VTVRELLSSKGFLFTISVIFFASTLIFYAQNYLFQTNASETYIISSAKPAAVLQLGDDLAFDIGRVLGIGIDSNSASGRIVLSGTLAALPNMNDAINDYESFLGGVFFQRVGLNQSIDFSSLSDNSAELFFGNSIEFDYNYGSTITLLPRDNSIISSLDLNLHSDGNLITYEFYPGYSSPQIQLNLNYIDDGNSFNIVTLLGANSSSVLKLVYSDGNTLISLGRVTIGGSEKNSVVKISATPLRRMNYILAAGYDANIVPVKWNAMLRSGYDKVDVNSFLTIKK